MSISVYTTTLGNRNFYLQKLFHFLDSHHDKILEWHIGIQGSDNDLGIPDKPWIKLHRWDTNCGAGEANNRLIKECSGEIICKLDDDALPYGEHYFNHIKEIYNLTGGNCIFSPYPVGLINNPGGVHSKEHFLIYGKNTDTYYTFRKVHHIGGFARIMPSKIAKSFCWPFDYSPLNSGREDVNFSEYCKTQNIPMFYLENSIIVEHLESTLGQKERYKEYFSERV
jgi:glycosyltransferase involved in cell wall biosynthesis